MWGDGYELYYVNGESTDPAYVGHFGYDEAKPRAYLGCTVTSIACIEGGLEVTSANPPRKTDGRSQADMRYNTT